MRRLDPDAMEGFAEGLIAHTGADDDVAEAVAASLVGADLRGHPSHGVRLIPSYYRRIDDGEIDPDARAEIVEEDDLAALVDGNDSFGQAVGRVAVDAAIRKARSGSLSLVGVRRATHLGRIGEFAERAAGASLGFAAFVSMTSGRPVAPPGSAKRRFGTNPVAFGLPTFGALDHPFLVDMATSQVAHGKIYARQMAGEAMDPGWAVDADGEPVTDPGAFNDDEVGALLPLGGLTSGYKGFGLSMVCELFAATLGDAVITGQSDASWGNSAVFVVFDPLRFTTREAHEARVGALARHIDATAYSPHVSPGAGAKGDRALVPGAAEHRTAVEYREAGIPVAERDLRALSDLAGEVGVDSPFSLHG